MSKDLLNAEAITTELLREQFLRNDFTTMPDTLPENMDDCEAVLYNKVIDFINDDWQEIAKEMGLKRPQICYSEDFIPEGLRLRVSRIVANSIIKITRDEKALDNMLTTFVMPQMFSSPTDEVGLSQSTVSRRLKKIALLGKDFEKLF